MFKTSIGIHGYNFLNSIATSFFLLTFSLCFENAKMSKK